MLYLLDANILIDANAGYLQISRVPEFWSWLEFRAEQGVIKMPHEIYNEILKGSPDPLTTWLRQKSVKDALLLDEMVEFNKVNRIINEGYAPNLNEVEIEALGRDPFLLAYALERSDRCVVSNELSKITQTRHKSKVPDVSARFGIPCTTVYHLIEDLDFSTSWAERNDA